GDHGSDSERRNELAATDRSVCRHLFVLGLRKPGEHAGVTGRLDIAHRTGRRIRRFTPFRELLSSGRIHPRCVSRGRPEITVGARAIATPVAEYYLQLAPRSLLLMGIYGTYARCDG